MARQQGLTDERIDEMTDYERSTVLTPREKMAVRFTDYFLKDPGGADAAFIEEMCRHFSEAEIVELGIAISLFSAFNKFIITLGLEHDSKTVQVVPTPSKLAAAARV
ncbi:MAG: carboxymuconolactone decarboxylase family protein [Chloroflexi bacterium]|nr:carboxymuconolactone decarboxylase family protein [Chloroflexota bacterium]